MAAFSSGWLFALGHPLAAVVLPVLVSMQVSQRGAWLTALAYFAGAGMDILEVGDYLTATNSRVPPALFWIAAVVVQSSAWGLCYRLRFRTTVASIVTALLPLGVLSWGHPWHTAGVLLPGAGVVGLGSLVVALELAARHPAISLLAPFSLLFTSADDATPAVRDWAAVNTHYGDVFHHPNQLSLIEHMTSTTNNRPEAVIVWPESMVPNFNTATAGFWPPIRHGKTIVFGGTVNTPSGYRNVVLFRGAEERSPVDQGVPVPFAMWQPLSSAAPSLSVASPVRMIAGHRAAFLVCYEQLLVWSYLRVLLDHPSVIVGISNVYWVRATSIPRVQAACLRSWARLFGIPYLQAVNR